MSPLTPDAERELQTVLDAEARRLLREQTDAALARKPLNAYQHAQAIAKGIKASSAGRAYDASGLTVISGPEHERITGYGAVPALMWEEGPYEWGVTFTGWTGEKLGALATDEPTREAYAAMRADGYYLECSNSFTVAVYRA